jgi:hypothetical protein
MARKRKSRRQQHGCAWHWKQTDCWYYTPAGTKKRVALFDEEGDRIRGIENKKVAQIAYAKLQIAGVHELSSPHQESWTVARVCDVYLTDLHKTANPSWARQVTNWLVRLCEYCGALKVNEFKKKHLRQWMQRYGKWSPKGP